MALCYREVVRSIPELDLLISSFNIVLENYWLKGKNYTSWNTNIHTHTQTMPKHTYTYSFAHRPSQGIYNLLTTLLRVPQYNLYPVSLLNGRKNRWQRLSTHWLWWMNFFGLLFYKKLQFFGSRSNSSSLHWNQQNPCQKYSSAGRASFLSSLCLLGALGCQLRYLCSLLIWRSHFSYVHLSMSS